MVVDVGQVQVLAAAARLRARPPRRTLAARGRVHTAPPPTRPADTAGSPAENAAGGMRSGHHWHGEQNREGE
jgi:hypothetical protein